MALRSFGRRPRAEEVDTGEAVAAEAAAAVPVPTPSRMQDTTIADIAARLHPFVTRAMDMTEAAKLRPEDLATQLQAFLEREGTGETQGLTPFDRRRVVAALINDIKGLGPLEPLFQDTSISDILVNGLRSVYVERRGKLTQVDIKFRDGQHLLRIAQRIAGWVGRRVDESSPMADLRLPDGSRVNIIIPPLAIDGPTISIRRFLLTGLTLEDLAAQGMIAPGMVALLRVCVKARLNVLISGGTGAGKTTLMNTLTSEISPDERLVTIEDAAELQVQQPHVVRLETRTMSAEGTGEVSMRALVINALRMRPDRIIVGEVRGGEAMEMLQAMNTGHPGSMSTIHANTPRDALIRLENMLLMGTAEMPLQVIRQQVASGLDLVVQVERIPSGRRCVTSITDVAGMENDVVLTEEMWRLSREGSEEVFEGSGRQPSWVKAVDRAGLRAELQQALQGARQDSGLGR